MEVLALCQSGECAFTPKGVWQAAHCEKCGRGFLVPRVGEEWTTPPNRCPACMRRLESERISKAALAEVNARIREKERGCG